MTAGGVERMHIVLDDVLAEVNRSIAKHGDQAHVPFGTGPATTPLYSTDRFLDDTMCAERLAEILKRRTDDRFSGTGDRPGSWVDILLEEVVEAFAENDLQKLRAEMIQVAAVAVKWCEAIDRKAAAS